MVYLIREILSSSTLHFILSTIREKFQATENTIYPELLILVKSSFLVSQFSNKNHEVNDDGRYNRSYSGNNKKKKNKKNKKKSKPRQ